MKKISFLMILLVALLGAQQVFAADFLDESNSYVVDDEGYIYDTTRSEYSETGEWKEDGVGFKEAVKKTSQTAGNVAGWEGALPPDNGFWELYIWRNVVENGDPNVRIDWYATGNSMGINFMDCSEGESGWEYLGHCNTSDNFIRVEVTASGNGVAPVCAFRLVRSTRDEFVNYINNDGKKVLTLKVGAEKALLNENTLPMSMGKAVIVNSRTMVPLRFVMEIMGADVEWDGTAKKAIITMGEKKTEFYIGSNKYTVNGEEKELDSPAYITENRTMVPLRALSEGLGKNVHWDDAGVIVITDSELSDYSQYVAKGLAL